jgi:phage baseplate assembly protein V
MRGPSDIPDTVGDLIRFGTIAEVDLAAGRCVVDTGDVRSAAVRWIEPRAGATRSWSPPSIGEQVLLICPDGDIAGAVALRGIASDAHPPAGDSLREIFAIFVDGCEIAYDPEAHRLEATLPAGGVARIVAPGGVEIEGDVTITGDVDVTGTLTASEDVKAGAISLKSHKHGNVQAGGAKTGGPE